MLKRSLLITCIAMVFAIKSFGQGTITYPTLPASLIISVAINGSISPVLSGLNAIAFKISPDLHTNTGLDFSTTTGDISGTPTKAGKAVYTITATTAHSPIITTVTINVVNPSPPVVSYPPSMNTFNINTDIELKPQTAAASGTSYSIEPGTPTLPSALHLDATTGYITGKSSNIIPAATYTIRATNGALNTTATVSINVTDPTAPLISYVSPTTLTVGTSATVAPLISGGIFTNYTINPDIHAITGLDFDPQSGIIRGVPTTIDSSRNYTITATVSAGNFRYANVAIKVQPAKPLTLYSPSVGHFFIDSLIVPMKPVDADTLNTVYTINQPLPKGLQFNNKTGAITGAPYETLEKGNTGIYVIKANYFGQETYYHIYMDISSYSDYVSKPATISFVGQGDIQQSLNNNAKLSANTGIGVVFRQNSSRRYGILHDIEIDFSINVASTVDTIKSINDKANKVTNQTDFGNSVLLPLNSGQAFSFSLKGFFSERGGRHGNYMRNSPPRSLLGVLSGFYLSVNGSNRNWEYVDNDKTVSPTSVKTSLLSTYLGTFFEFITPKKSNNYGQNSSITLGVGLSSRWILGMCSKATIAS